MLLLERTNIPQKHSGHGSAAEGSGKELNIPNASRSPLPEQRQRFVVCHQAAETQLRVAVPLP